MNFGDAVQITGCSVKARHLETSSGNSSIDALLGGALPNTSVYTLDEPQSRCYSEVLLKYFISEGLYNGHDIFLADPDTSRDLYSSIPSRSEDVSKPSSSAESDRATSDMKIAFRYSATPQMNSVIGAKNRYDLAKPLTDLNVFPSERIRLPERDADLSYQDVHKVLSNLLKSEKYSKQRGAKKNLLRIVIRDVGSPLWSDPENLSRFLVRLQSLVRNAYVVVALTTSSSSMNNETIRELETSSDIYLRLIAISDEEKKALPSLDKFHGYLQLIRLPRLTSVATICPPAIDLVFELHRKSFDVKILHLPPALDEKDVSASAKSACATAIDF